MEVEIKSEKKEINILDDGYIISKLYFIPSFFIWEFASIITKDNPVKISKEDNEVFFANLEWLMNQKYSFYSDYFSKTDEKLIWLSEHCFDLEDEAQVDVTPRINIEKKDNEFIIYPNTPYFEKNNIRNTGTAISFAPAGNGHYAKNIYTIKNLQDEIINMFYYTLNNEKILRDKTMTKKPKQ